MKKWKKFENKTHEIVQSLNPNANVYKNVFIKGLLSKKRRQVDLKMVKPEEYEFLALECKDYNRPVDIPIVEEFNTKLLDIGTKRGAIVSNSSFTPGAMNIASELKIDLLSIVDTGDPDIRTRLYAKTLLSDTQSKGFSIRLSSSGSLGAGIPLDPKEFRFVINDKRDTLTAPQIFAKLWNGGDLSETPGSYVYTPPNPDQKKILSVDGQVVKLDNIAFYYDVVKRHFIGDIEIIEAKGIYNVRDKSFQTKSITTEPIVAYEVEKVWKEISADEAKISEIGFGLSCKSLFPEET